MSDTDRVQRWREAKRQAGQESMTLWFSHETRLRVEDLARTWRCSPSELVERALAQFHPGQPSSISNSTDTSQLREWMREELVAILTAQFPATDTVTVTVAGAPPEETPGISPVVIAHVADMRNGSVTDTQIPGEAPAGLKQCRYQHEPYPAEKAGCPTCARDRKRHERERKRQRQAQPA